MRGMTYQHHGLLLEKREKRPLKIYIREGCSHEGRGKKLL
jgi:hypothetical protein